MTDYRVSHSIVILDKINYNIYISKEESPMRCEVKLLVAGRLFYEEVEARDYSDARQTALARNPKATVVSVNAKF